MRLVTATRVLNEDDILEAFVRHHRPLVDHLLFLDNGSHDRSCDILGSLRDEGMPITLLQVRSAAFEEANHLTMLHRYAAMALGADWVVHLDADEFLDGRASRLTLRGLLREVPDHFLTVQLRLVLYQDTTADDAAEPIVPKRLSRRCAERHDIFKVLVRGGEAAGRTTIHPGNHGASLDGQITEPQIEERWRLAHYPRRSSWQQITKFTVGWLKAQAGGQQVLDYNFARHYEPMIEILRDRPMDILHAPGFMEPTQADTAVLDPIQYQGTMLRYTPSENPQMKAVTSLVGYAMELAAQHGRLVDESSDARSLLQSWVTKVARLF